MDTSTLLAGVRPLVACKTIAAEARAQAHLRRALEEAVAVGDVTSCLVNTLAGLRPPVEAGVLAGVVTAGNAIVNEFLHGFRATSPSVEVLDARRELASILLTDRPLPVSGRIPVAESYASALCAGGSRGCRSR